VLALGLTSSSFGALIVDFKPDPISPTIPEVAWSGTALAEAPGSVGNSDGTTPSALQTPGGYLIQTPFVINGIPGSSLTNNNTATTFYDVTLDLSGFSASPGAAATNIAGVTIVSQPLAEGAFSLWSTDPDDAGPASPTLLLSGTVGTAVVVGLGGQQTGSVQSTSLTYTGGAIYDAMVAAGFQAGNGSFSWSLLDISTQGGLQLGQNQNVAAFNANMTGLFSAVPEPASLSMLALGSLALAHRRRKA
jgi:hypothetical protein